MHIFRIAVTDRRGETPLSRIVRCYFPTFILWTMLYLATTTPSCVPSPADQWNRRNRHKNRTLKKLTGHELHQPTNWLFLKYTGKRSRCDVDKQISKFIQSSTKDAKNKNLQRNNVANKYDTSRQKQKCKNAQLRNVFCSLINTQNKRIEAMVESTDCKPRRPI